MIRSPYENGSPEDSANTWNSVGRGNQGDKALCGTELIDLRLTLHQQGHGMFVCLKKSVSTSLVAGIGDDLVSVPECENEEAHGTGQECGRDLQNDESGAKESKQPTWPAFRLLVRRNNSERSCHEQPGKRCPLAE
jgi:hypothetical protein